jgi:uncharacterized protein (DUF433 family)
MKTRAETEASRSTRVRVQLDLTPVEVTLLEVLQARLAVRSRADLLQQAVGAFLWIVQEMLSGRRIVSADTDALADLPRYKELSLSAVSPLTFDLYDHLVVRSDTGRDQPYLKGRTMTVGQLVYKMRANELSAEQAAADMDLPLAQVREAVAYYHTHRDLVDGEMAEEVRALEALELGRDTRALPR